MIKFVHKIVNQLVDLVVCCFGLFSGNLSCKSASRCKVNIHWLYLTILHGHCHHHLLIVTCCSVSINAVLEQFDFILTILKEVQFQLHITLSPVSQTTYVPSVSAATSNHDIVCDLSINCLCFIPNCRNCCDETCALRLILIVTRIVTKHIER